MIVDHDLLIHDFFVDAATFDISIFFWLERTLPYCSLNTQTHQEEEALVLLIFDPKRIFYWSIDLRPIIRLSQSKTKQTHF